MFAISSIARMFPDANFTIGHGLPRLAVAAISLVALEASSQSSHQPANQERASIMTMKDDLANRSLEIHWPPGFDPRKADLFSQMKLAMDVTLRICVRPTKD